jgi:hypothetical protein
MTDDRPLTMPPACAAFDATVQRVLDGDLPPAALAEAHALDCHECRELAGATRVLLEGLATIPSPVPPADFADRIVPAAVAERKRSADRRWTARVAAFTLAASVLTAFVLANPWRPTAPRSQEMVAVTKTPPSVAKSFAEAGSAFVSLTKRAADESFAPAKSLFANIDLPKPTPAVAPPDAPDAASAVRPITNTAKRALNLFIRDVGGLATIPQMKS